VLDACIWICAAEEISYQASVLEELYGIELPASRIAGVPVRGSLDAGLQLIAPDTGVVPGIWGIVIATDDTRELLHQLPLAAQDEQSRLVHAVLSAQRVRYAGQFLGVHQYVRERRRPSLPDRPRRAPGAQPYPYLFAWVVQPDRLDVHVKSLAAGIGADFELVEILGARVALSWDSGLELIAPEPREISAVDGRLDETTTDVHYDHLCKYGESPWSVVIRVSDIEAFRNRAADLGHEVSPVLQDPAPERRRAAYRAWTRKIIDQREVRLFGFLGLRLMAGEVVYATDST
jgi:hypothetical protein